MNTALSQHPTKSIIYLLFMVVSGLLIGNCGGTHTETFHWRLQSHATEKSLDYVELVKMAEQISIMSNRRLVIDVFPGGVHAHGPDIYNAVATGQVQMGNGWPNWWSAQHPSWAVMNAGPFDLMNIDASMIFFYTQNGIEMANQLAAPDGIIWRPAWWPGMEFGLLSKKPLLGLDDLKGKRVRIGPGLPSEVLAEAAGSLSIPLVPEEIHDALKEGSLDAVEWTTTSGAWALGLQDLAVHALVPAIWQPSVLSDFLINEKAYSELPADLQAILENALKSYTLTTTIKNKYADIEALEKFEQNHTQFHRWTQNDLKRWQEATDKIIERYKNVDKISRQVIDAKHSFKSRYEHYYEYFGPYKLDTQATSITPTNASKNASPMMNRTP